MESSLIVSNYNTSLLSGGRFLMNNHPRGTTRGGAATATGKVVKAMKSGDHHHHHHNNNHYEGKLVDENMIILRVRIKKMKMSQRNGNGVGAPQNWMEWEKKYFGEQYHEDVCEVVGLLQVLLMNTRPSLALGVMLVIALSLPISTYIVMHNTSDIVQELLSKLHFISCMYF